MPHTILFFLKLIGYIFLAALCLVLLVLCAALFVPLKYRAEVFVKNTVDSVRINLNFSWLLNLIGGRFSCRDKKAEWAVHIAWKQLPSKQKEGRAAAPIPKKDAEKKGTPIGETQGVKKEETTEKKGPLTEKSKDKNRKIYDIIKSLKSKADASAGFLADDVHKAALLKLLRETKVFLLDIKPDKLAGFVRYGLEDPSATGKIFALISMLYPFLGREFEAVPDFSEKLIEADLNVSGRFRAVYVAVLVLKLIADKNIRVTFKHIKKLINTVSD